MLHAPQIGSVFYDRRFLLTDALPNVYAELYPGAGPPPLTTISPGVVVNSALQVRRLAAVLPKGSNLTHIINMGLDTLADGLTVYRCAHRDVERELILVSCAPFFTISPVWTSAVTRRLNLKTAGLWLNAKTST